MAEPAVTFEDGHPVVDVTPVGSAGHRSSGWVGVLLLICTEAALFLYLQFSYYFLLVWDDGSLLPRELPKFTLSVPNTIILIASSFVVWWGERGARKGSRLQLALGTGIGALMGIVFLIIQAFEWYDKPFRWDTSVYGSLYFTVTGFHMAHVALGVIILLTLFLWTLLGYFDPRRHAPVSIGAIYWHFVDVVWITIFFTFYITPYLGSANG